ncbi:MAG: hypothetical protein H0V45_10670 [Actinobacteria bacterium]|nr:hypothetical protein [Actinomycetota bacterium]
MARILIREDALQLELLLATVVERSGHEAVRLGSRAEAGIEGDLLLLAPTAAGALEWVAELRRGDSGVPVVCVGPDPDDPHADAIGPAAIVPKPFRVLELSRAIEKSLHERS